jgi:hypothetical protein
MEEPRCYGMMESKIGPASSTGLRHPAAKTHKNRYPLSFHRSE